MPIFNDHRTKASLGQDQHDSIAVQSFWGSYSRWKRTWRIVTQSVSVEVAQREGRLQHYPMFCDNQINVPNAVFHGTISYAQRAYLNKRALPQNDSKVIKACWIVAEYVAVGIHSWCTVTQNPLISFTPSVIHSNMVSFSVAHNTMSDVLCQSDVSIML